MSESNKKQDLFLYRYKKNKLIKRSKKKQVWRVENTNCNEICILKLQSNKNISASQRNILHQANFLHSMQGHLGFPFMIWSGQQSQNMLLFVEELGHSLDYLFKYICRGKFTLKTVCMIGIQLVKIIQDYHLMGFVHRRLLPSAISLGKKSKNHLLYLNDLFDSKKYTDQKTNKPYQLKKNSKLSSHLSAFTTLNQLQCGQSSRRDDLQAILLILIYFLKGKLPWQGIIYSDIDNDLKMSQLKNAISAISIQSLCYGLPKQFSTMLKMVRELKFTQEPKYEYFIQNFENLLFGINKMNDFIFDWINPAFRYIPNKTVIDQCKISENLPDFTIENEQALLKLFFYPFYRSVDIDEITQKFRSKKQIEEDIVYSDVEQLYRDVKVSKKIELTKKKSQCQIM